ncbi:MAG TPA: hypothetical protein VFK85_12945 [Anaeromyxobacteraceae bacterium]|nr:hypothetical protein [Anaeromyxobacteraceae bacterium]
MRFLTWNLALSTWLLVSCFALPQTAASIVVTYATWVVVLCVSIAAFARPALRYFISLAALTLATCALLLPDVSWSARISDFLTAALLFALSLVSPRHARWEGDTATTSEESAESSAPAHSTSLS